MNTVNLQLYFFYISFRSVLRIPDVYLGWLSRIRIFPSRIQGQKDFGSASRNLSIFSSKNCFLSSRKYDPGCSSRIRILILFRIPDPRVKNSSNPGSRIRIRNTGLVFIFSRIFHGYAFVYFVYNNLFYITLD
jgi:hypothetical protein